MPSRLPSLSYSCVIWDFDGTLADTLTTGLEIYNQLAEKQGFKPVEDPESVRNLDLKSFLRQHRIPLVKVPILVKKFLALQKERIGSVSLFAGIPEVLRQLREKGVRLGILSSNSRENIESCLQNNGVDELFDFVVGYPRLFGKARALRRLAKKYQTDSQRLLYIGDEIRDLQAGQKAGVATAAVTWGFNNADALEKYAPKFLLHKPEELLNYTS